MVYIPPRTLSSSSAQLPQVARHIFFLRFPSSSYLLLQVLHSRLMSSWPLSRVVVPVTSCLVLSPREIQRDTHLLPAHHHPVPPAEAHLITFRSHRGLLSTRESQVPYNRHYLALGLLGGSAYPVGVWLARCLEAKRSSKPSRCWNESYYLPNIKTQGSTLYR